MNYIITTFDDYLNESFKLKSSDKDEINKILRNNYEKYKSDIKKLNNDIKLAKRLMNHVKENPHEFPEDAFRDSHFDYNSKLEYDKPMLYNKYYDENYKSVERDHIRYKTRNATTNFQYKSKQEDVLKKINYDEYYNSLSKQEKVNIKIFLNNIGERINSGTGESISRKYVRDSFFNTPKSFQQMFSEKPNQYLWRGDYTHPCDPDYDHKDKNYLMMQSFSTSKNTASSFGFNFKATNIKSYSGSFSLDLYLKYGNNLGVDFGDDEGEVMFFDVVYKCDKK